MFSTSLADACDTKMGAGPCTPPAGLPHRATPPSPGSSGRIVNWALLVRAAVQRAAAARKAIDDLIGVLRRHPDEGGRGSYPPMLHATCVASLLRGCRRQLSLKTVAAGLPPMPNARLHESRIPTAATQARAKEPVQSSSRLERLERLEGGSGTGMQLIGDQPGPGRQ